MTFDYFFLFDLTSVARFVYAFYVGKSVGRKTERETVETEREKHYRLLDNSIEILNEATGRYWELIPTGGGCSAFATYVCDGFFMVTDEGASAPTPDELGAIMLGWYPNDPDNDGDIIDDVGTLDSLAVWFSHYEEGR